MTIVSLAARRRAANLRPAPEAENDFADAATATSPSRRRNRPDGTRPIWQCQTICRYPSLLDADEPVRVQGKFFFAGERKQFVRGVTYGPFAPGTHGAQFPERATVQRDFALMRGAGANTVRVFTVPPVWLLDLAAEAGLKVLVGLPWTQHVAFLDSEVIKTEIRAAITAGVRACARHRAVFAYLVGNEIPPDMIRWHGADAVREFLRELVTLVRVGAPGSAGQLRQFPVERISQYRFHRFRLFQRLSARRGRLPPLYRAAAQSGGRQAAGPDRVRRRFDA